MSLGAKIIQLNLCTGEISPALVTLWSFHVSRFDLYQLNIADKDLSDGLAEIVQISVLIGYENNYPKATFKELAR